MNDSNNKRSVWSYILPYFFTVLFVVLVVGFIVRYLLVGASTVTFEEGSLDTVLRVDVANQETYDKNASYSDMIGIAIIAAASGVGAGYWAASAAAGFGHNLRKDMYYHIQDFSFNNIDKFSTSSIVTRLTTDVSNVQFAFQMAIRAVLRAPLIMTISIVVLLPP